MALISVIVPNYNHARFLERRMESILNQTFRDFEIILLDDASTDNSSEIIERYRRHPKVKAIVYNAVNSGSPFKQWAKGLDMTESAWVWIAESDDYCEPNFLESLMPGLTHDNCVLAFAEISWIDEDGKVIMAGSEKPPALYEGKQFLREYMVLQDYLVNAGMIVFNHSATLHVSPDWLRMKQAGDYWFWCEIARQGIVYACGKKLAYFTRHPEAHSNSLLHTPDNVQECLQVIDRMYSLQSILHQDMRRYFTDKLVQLYTWQKAIPADSFAATEGLWKEQANQRKINISAIELFMKSKLRKLNHRLKKSLRKYS